jgi:hypothetical protein
VMQVISPVMTSSSHKLWRHHLTSCDVIISQVVTSSSHKWWRHHLTSYTRSIAPSYPI